MNCLDRIQNGCVETYVAWSMGRSNYKDYLAAERALVSAEGAVEIAHRHVNDEDGRDYYRGSGLCPHCREDILRHRWHLLTNRPNQRVDKQEELERHRTIYKTIKEESPAFRAYGVAMDALLQEENRLCALVTRIYPSEAHSWGDVIDCRAKMENIRHSGRQSIARVKAAVSFFFKVGVMFASMVAVAAITTNPIVRGIFLVSYVVSAVVLPASQYRMESTARAVSYFALAMIPASFYFGLFSGFTLSDKIITSSFLAIVGLVSASASNAFSPV